MNTQACGCVEQPCDCCQGVQISTPASECNRPGLDVLSYRVGTHSAFLATMKARLSTMEVDGVGPDGQTVTTFRPLQGLTTRDSSDPSIALLDGWASVGDVLSFYQERIANEGYLRTATERRSVLELANLVGYTLRPGVAAAVYLAYTIDEKQTDPVTIPVGARVQSVPGPGEKPQSFETSDPLEARSMWNGFRPRTSRAQTAQTVLDGTGGGGRVYLQGIGTNLKANDALVIDDGTAIDAYRVLKVTPDPALNRTLVTFAAWRAGIVAGSHGAGAAKPTRATGPSLQSPGGAAAAAPIDQTIGIMQKLTLPPSLPPRSALTVTRDLKATFISGQADIAGQIVTAFQPLLQGAFDAAVANAPVTSRGSLRVYALRVKAAPFGQLAPRKSHFDKDSGTLQDDGEWPIVDGFGAGQVVHEQEDAVFLDGEYDKIQPASYVLLDTSAVSTTAGIVQVKPAKPPYLITQAKSVQAGVARAAYGITGKTTRIGLADAWLDITPIQVLANHGETIGDRDFRVIRSTTIFAQSEELPLADEPVVGDICKGASSWIELDGLYSELKSGRWAIVSGERTDVTVPDPDDPTKTIAVSGIKAHELVMLANVVQDVALPDGTPQSVYQPPTTFDVVVPPPNPLGGEKRHTFLQFEKDLQYCYARDTIRIYGNVVKATHGETRNEVLGNGDGTSALQSFTLKQPPLTFIAAPTAVGADSTLHAYVNDVEWHETDSLAFLGPKDCGFVTSTDDAANTTLTFGSGVNGARVPTGLLNVKAVYRNGIGNAGNVRAEQISLLQTRPLGVKDVINPMRASGGADKESRDLARENAPLSVMSLDRLVSVQDYADFTRRFAGIAKALAAKTSDGGHELVYLTIAGVDDGPVDATSDLYRNLVEALHGLGDPDLPFRVDLRELKMLVLSAKIRILADYLWEPVVTAVRAMLLDRFGFGKRALGQPVRLSEVIRIIQGVRGVVYVDVDALGAIPEKVADVTQDGAVVRRLLTPAEIAAQVQSVVDPDAVLKIARSPAGRDRLPRTVGAWPGGSDGGALRPAELVIFTPAVPDTLILNQIP